MLAQKNAKCSRTLFSLFLCQICRKSFQIKFDLSVYFLFSAIEDIVIFKEMEIGGETLDDDTSVANVIQNSRITHALYVIVILIILYNVYNVI